MKNNVIHYVNQLRFSPHMKDNNKYNKKVLYFHI